ncbi:hypothetical protein LMG29542_07188 [Paraburkholderia humisilvae]|uniref:Adenine DNA glycosylase C-terminal domain-containing protein n=1 Tax=Paraburkholderia humisilvae TaxID=627669 RepID=A0A6J5F854_9BURK|nr:hypothetical protein LMG29542_07188 [Paraburkholderia humisilvae]
MNSAADNRAQPAARPVTEVAVGVLVQPDGRYLLAQRPAGKPYEGYWEFPGGELEAGETVEAARLPANCTRNWVSTSRRAINGIRLNTIMRTRMYGFIFAR